MPGPESSESVVIRRTFCPSASNPSPAHRVGRDRLAHATFDRERLEVGQALLKSQTLLVKVLAPPPEVERDSPAGLLFLAQDLDDLLQPTLVMRGQRVDAARDVGEWPPVRREHLPGFEGCHAAQAGEVVVERVGRALGMKADI